MKTIVHDLREQSTWSLLGLTFITYGVYAGFYTRRQTLKLNQHLPVGDQLSLSLPNIVIALNLLSLVFLVPYLLVEPGHAMEDVSDLADVPANIGFIFWGFAARGRMNRLLSAQPGESRWFHGLWTFLFSPLYFNYKVNALADEHPASSPAA